MKSRANRLVEKFLGLFLVVAVVGVFGAQAFAAASLSPSLEMNLGNVTDEVELGMVIVAFNTNNGLQESHLNVLRSVGVTGGQTYPNLGMVAQPMTAGQIRALAQKPEVRSIWSNDPIFLYMNQARVLTGVERLRADRPMQIANGGMPVSGDGNFSVMVIDSGVDATHEDLKFGTKTIQNVQTMAGTTTVSGFTPNVSIENVPNTSQRVGHATHCACIIAGPAICW